MIKRDKTILYILLHLSSFSMVFSGPETAINRLDSKNVENYLAPIGTMLSTGLNSGYSSKVSSHKLLGFDITLNIANVMLPSNSKDYNFIVPDDSIHYLFPFKFPKSYVVEYEQDPLAQDWILMHIPNANTNGSDPSHFSNDGLFQDYNIEFRLPLNTLLFLSEGQSAPTIFGDSTSPLQFDFNIAGDALYNHIADGIWEEVKGTPGIGDTLWVYGDWGLIAKTSPLDSTSFRDYFAENESLRDTLQTTLEAMNINMFVPGGFGHLFGKSISLPILQASCGLPYHTEITIRALPKLNISSIGTLQYGGIGGKVDISKHINDLFTHGPIYADKLDMASYSNIFTKNIKTEDVEKALNDFRVYDLDTQELDSLNYLFLQGDTLVIKRIQKNIKKTVSKYKNLPRALITMEGDQLVSPNDISLGYYINYYKLSLGAPEIKSINSIILIQAGKKFDTSFASWLEDLGIYGGFGFESSNIDLSYTYTNTLNESNDISKSFSGKNAFRGLIGTRMKISYVDFYIDYNIGVSNTINTGFGITFK